MAADWWVGRSCGHRMGEKGPCEYANNTIIAVEGLGAIEQAQATVAQVNWGQYGPAADVLDRALAMARTAAMQMQNAVTLEDFVAGRKLANLANEELVKAVKLAESIEKKPTGVSGIGEVDQAIGDIAQAQAEVDQINWEGMKPAADVLKRGMAMARTAAIQMRDAKTPAEYAVACRLANKANAEMVKASEMADRIEQQAVISGIGFSLSSLAKSVKKAASRLSPKVLSLWRKPRRRRQPQRPRRSPRRRQRSSRRRLPQQPRASSLRPRCRSRSCRP